DPAPREELIGRPPPNFRSPGKYAEHLEQIRRVLAGETLSAEYESQCADGTKKFIESRTVRIDYGGEPRVLRVVRDVGDKHKREKELRESEERYREIFEASIDGFALLDNNGIVVDTNAALHRIDGFSREEVIGQLPPTFRGEEEALYLKQFLGKVLEGEQVSVELELICKDGTMRMVDTTSVKIRYRGKDHVLVIVRDIHEQRRAVVAMAQTESRYQAIFDSSLDGLVILDREGIVIDVNPAILEIDGYSKDELIGQYPPGFRDPKNLATHLEWINRVLSGEKIRHQARLPRKDGSNYFAEMSSTAIDYEGEQRVLVVVRDVTDRMRKESALKRSQARFQATIVSALDCVISINEAGQILGFNPAAEETFGYSAAEVIGQNMADIIIPERLREVHNRGMSRYLESGEPRMMGRRVEVTAQRSDGSEFPAELSISASEEASGTVFTGFLRDLTEQKRAADERAMLEAQLRQAQKMEAIGHLTGGVAHDFNNILTGVLGYVEMARDQLDPEADQKLEKYLNRAQRSGEKARDLIRQMLTFSRGDAGQPRPIALTPIVLESLSLLESTVPSSVSITTDLPTELPTVVLDPVHIEQILVNLCINARDAMDNSGKLHVSLRVINGDTCVCSSCSLNLAGDYVELGVTDSGPGIEPALISRIFEPFFSTKETGKGSGMGLATVHGIIHEHGGHIIVDGEKGVGTTMRVLFPAEDSPLREADKDENIVPPRDNGEGLKGSVLVVDDNQQVAEFLEELLSEWGLEVTVFDGGDAALKHFLARPDAYSLVITDQTMPEVTGLQLAEALLKEKPDLPIILYTGYSDVANSDLIEKTGIRALVQKPLNIPEFRQTVEQLLAE
ncbi:MAG: hybrid sensor histidine kinase/response regulator, partial [Gammaproteobacteria bacterium]